MTIRKLLLLFIVSISCAPSVFAGPVGPGGGTSWKDGSGAVTTSKDVGINTISPQYPLDVRGDLFLPQQATSVDCDGTATINKGTCAAIADGATLVPLLTSNVDIDGGGVADTNWLCVDSYNTPTIVAESLTTTCEFGIDPAIFAGTGLNDATSGGAFSDTANDTYTIIIDATGTPDTFKWEKNSGSYTPGVSLTGSAQTLSDGITITFAATTGHTLNDQWSITAKTAGYKLLGTINAGTPIITYKRIDRTFSFVDADADTWFDNGEDLYFGAAPINRYSPTSSVIHGAVVVDGSVIIGGTSGAGGTVCSPTKVVQGQTTLSFGSAIVTLSGADVFTGTTAYSVTASRSDSVAYTHSLKIINNSGSQFTIVSSDGTDSDTVAWIAAED